MEQRPVLVLMRGLPSCGKSTTARKLAAADGVVLEFDRYFHDHVGEDSARFDWRPELRQAARRWLVARLREALAAGRDPIVIDDDCGPGRTTRACAWLGWLHGYAVRTCEPRSPWWPAVRRALERREQDPDALVAWARKLALLNRGTHRMSAGEILRRMRGWPLTLELDHLRPVPRRA